MKTADHDIFNSNNQFLVKEKVKEKTTQSRLNTYNSVLGSTQFRNATDQTNNKKIFNLDKIVNTEYKKPNDSFVSKYKKHYNCGFRDHIGYYRDEIK